MTGAEDTAGGENEKETGEQEVMESREGGEGGGEHRIKSEDWNSN